MQESDGFCGQCGAAQATPPPSDAESVPEPAVGPVLHRFGYERGVEHLDPLGAAYTAAATRQAIAYSLLAAFVSVVIWLFGRGAGADVNGLIGFVWIVAFLVYLFVPIPVSLAEWKLLIEDKAPLAQNVFGHVGHTLRRRQAPVQIKVRQLSQPGHPRRDYLQVRHGILSGYVTCFPYGVDLYLGWTLWWRFSPLHYALMATGRRWQVFTGRGTELHLLYRYDIAKAMREALHSSVTEAVEAAWGLRPLAPLPDDVVVEVVSASSQLIQPAAPPSSA